MIRTWGFDVAGAIDGEDALDRLPRYDPHVLISDLKMPRRDGLSLLKEMRRLGVGIPALIISGEGDIPEAVAAIKLGARDYVRKPIDPPHLRALLNALAQDPCCADRSSGSRTQTGADTPVLIGKSRAVREALAFIEKVAPSTSSVMIVGESGTGKEVAAALIHNLSTRHTGPYVAVNCAAIPETLMEAELFGHERGSFTGAERRYEGCFERANGGTLLLDEITEMKPELQAKLLRVLEDRRMRRLGGVSEIPVGRKGAGDDQSQSAAGDAGGAVARRPFLPAERLFHRVAAAASTAGGHRAVSRPFHHNAGRPLPPRQGRGQRFSKDARGLFVARECAAVAQRD